jgi:hypothetical protein
MKFKSEVQLEALNNATVDTDKFLVSDSSTLKYRTGTEVLSDIGAISSVTATSPITSTGGTTPVISTSMATNKLIGRSTAGTGVMEEITIGSGLALSGGTLSSSGSPSSILHGTAAGTDTYTVTIAGATAYADGDAYLIRFTNGNTTGATLNINSLGAIPLYRNNDGAVIGGDIWAGAEMLCIYNSTITAFQCIGTSSNSLFAYVTNADSVAITKGQPVYAFGGTGDRLTVKRAFNTSDAGSARTIGVVLTSSIAVNQKGIIIIEGLLDGLNILPTSTWADGDTVYLGTTAGSITNVKQYAPNHLVYLGTVTTASNGSSGRWYVKVQNGYELDELHNVQAQTPSLKDTLWYDNTVSPGQWKTASIPTILGYTPANASGTTNYVSKFTGTTTLGNSQIFDNGTSVGIGIATPTGKLNVNGVVKIEGNNSLYMGGGGSSVPTWGITPNGNNLEISGVATNITGNVNFINLGNVGIGTSNPGHKLQVSGTAGTSWSTLLQSNSKSAVYSAHADGYGMAIETSQNTSAIYTFKVAGGDGTNIGTNEYFRITGIGNVGIGTSSPNEKLVVGNLGGGVKRIYVPGTYNFDGSYLSNYDGNGGGKLELVAHTGVSNSASWRIANNNDTYGQSLTFSYAPNTTSYSALSYSAPAMLIANTGNVGIGTTSPLSKLDIVSSTNDSFDSIIVRPNNLTQTLSLGWQGVSASLNFIVNAGASERMRITSVGNTGINTSIPETRLQIEDITKVLTNNVAGVAQGTLSLVSTDAQAANIGASLVFGGNYITSNSSRIAYAAITGRKSNSTSSNADGYLSFLTWRTSGLTEAMRITANGDVGVGTTTPLLTSAGRGNITINGSSQSVLTLATGGVWKGYLYSDGTNTDLSSAASLIFGVSGGIEAARIIAGSGHLGVGTTNPTSRIHSVSNSSGPVSYDNRCAVFGYNTATETLYNNGVGIAGRVLTSGGRAVYGDALTGSGWGGYFDGRGYFLNQLLIGTTDINTPTYGSAAQFVTSSSTGGVIDIRNINTTIGTGTLLGRIQFTGKSDASVGYTAAAIDVITSNTAGTGSSGGGILRFMTAAAGGGQTPTARMWINQAGYVSIGLTNTASYPLRVTTQVSNISIYADYDIVAFSDKSVKENIRPIKNVVERIQKSRGVLYDRIDSESKDNIGFIAQELEVAFPELVVTNEDGTKAVKYQNAVAVLFEAVKEQQKQIDEIKQILNGLTN